MTSRNELVKHRFAGGWATDFSPRVDMATDQARTLGIPYLLTAENIEFELDGSLRKARGATKINSAQMESGASIMGGCDAWFLGSSGTPAQARVVAVGTKLKADEGDGTFVDIKTGLAADAVPTFAMLEDLLVIGLDSTDVPQSYDGSTCQDLAGSPPNCAIFCTHANRLWAAGNDSAPSKLYYSPLLDPENATGEGWGVINVDPGDGDRITALYSHKGELFVHKGPNHGSIHRIAGTAPTGQDGYRRQRWVEGIGAGWHNTQFRFQDDVGFMSFDGSVHTLKTVAAYGDYREAALSRPIHKFLKRLNLSRMRYFTAAHVRLDGMVLFSLAIDGSTDNNAVIGFDYRFEEPRWFYWPAYDDTQCVFTGIDTANGSARRFFFGGTDGYLRTNQIARTIDTSGVISMRVVTPYLSYGAPLNMKTAGEAYLQLSPLNSGLIDFVFRRDSASPQTFEIDQNAGDVLGPVTSGAAFTLDSSTLGEASVIERFIEADPVGEFRQIQYQFANDVAGEDAQIHGFGVSVNVGSVTTEN